MHDHTSPVNAMDLGSDLPLRGFGPSLAGMTANRAPRHASLLLVALAGTALGCGSKQATPVLTAGGAAAGGIKIDPTRCNPSGKQVVTSDVDGDKKADVTKLYEVREVGGQKTQILACKQVDLNHDGKIDIVYHHDQAGALAFEEFDLDFDGKFEVWTYYQQGQKVREDRDMNYDGRPDLTEYFEGGRKVRVELDTDHDGKVDQWEYYEGGKLDRIGYDSTGSGRADRWDRAPESAELAGAGGAAPAEGAPAAPAAPPATGPAAAPTTAPPSPPPAPPAQPTAPPAKR
jgi:EF hand domain-containing protein